MPSIIAVSDYGEDMRKLYEDFIEAKREMCEENDEFDSSEYLKYDVKKGLRDATGNGVIVGLTEISQVDGTIVVDGIKQECEGILRYRGYSIEELTSGFLNKRYGFEEISYLVIFGKLPTQKELSEYMSIVNKHRKLPKTFTRDVIMKAANKDVMNAISREILFLASYDEDALDNSIENVLRQCLYLITVFPMLVVYSYHAYNHYINNQSMYIHNPDPKLSTAENFLRMLRPDKKYSKLEATVLDLALVLHMEHGGGNNSTFTTRVTTSSGSDTYAVIAAAMSSLKGPKHGGANLKVMDMMADIKKHVKDPDDEEALKAYLNKILDKQAFDKTGLIYGMGHAIYTKSDPRANVFKSFVEDLAREKGRLRDFKYYKNIERIAPGLIMAHKHNSKSVCANVDFYSGFVYNMLDIPKEVYTPLFATARIIGWSAHRIEELITSNKILRPAYVNIQQPRDYVPIEKR
jgi:citrate synthase